MHHGTDIYTVEGCFTMFVSIVLLLFLPGSPDQPRPLLSPGLVKIRPHEAAAIRRRIEADDGERKHGAQGMRIPVSLVWKTVKHWQRWPTLIAAFAVFSTWSPLTTYTPSIIVALGFDRIEANALACVGGFLALGVVFFFGWLSDKTNKRGLCVIIAHTCYLVVLIVARSVHPNVGKWSRWGLWTSVNAFAIGYHPVSNSWIQLNCKEPGERSISIAMWVMSAISGLMVGTQYFRQSDLPFYNTGLRTMILMVATGEIVAIVQEIIYITHNRRAEKKWREEGGEKPWLYVP